MYQNKNNTGKWIGIGLGVLLAAIVISIVLLGGKEPEYTPAPTSFVAYNAPDNAFVCEAPAGWEHSSGAAHAVMSGVLFRKGNARIEITSDLMGSLMGDVARATAAPLENLSPDQLATLQQTAPGLAVKPKPPVETLHSARREAVTKGLKAYHEQPMQSFSSPMGDACFSEWTADGGFFVGKLHGYRVTILGGERRASIVCQSSEANWPALKPAFEHTIGSLNRGNG
ncbi:MAG: hypothetical protein C4321_09090 [Chloroflexota bacterium]